MEHCDLTVVYEGSIGDQTNEAKSKQEKLIILRAKNCPNRTPV